MGLLDQAIREHLELKRQHGADPGELARLEREALGPPVRETQEVLTAAGGPAAPSAGGPPTDAGEAEPERWADESDAEPAGDATVQFDAEQAMTDEANGSAGETAPTEPATAGEPTQPAAPPPAAAEPPAPAGEPTAPALAEEPAPAPAEEPAPAPAEEPEAVDPATSPPVEDLPGGAAEEEGGEDVLEETEGGEDVLEETPEFLQETPEHDRLWFEQRPPRDFDFDG